MAAYGALSTWPALCVDVSDAAALKKLAGSIAKET